jgi:trehalose 6-phosphate phosphatase
MALVDAMREIVRTDRLLVALDFDGTLAPEVDDPEEARATPAARDAVLRLLEMPRTSLALISGRAMRSLERVSDLPANALLIGSHGIEVRLSTPDAHSTLATSELERVSLLGEVLGKVADSFDRVWLEPKPAGFAMHSRLASVEDAAAAERVALDVTSAVIDNLTVRSGKNVLEFSVRSTTKGDGIERLREHSGATAVFFAGDDVTDEDAFATLRPGDIGLKVGGGKTLAAHRVRGTDDTARVIALLADLREAESRSR